MAILMNLAPHMSNLHSYASLRLLGLYELLSKVKYLTTLRYKSVPSMDLAR